MDEQGGMCAANVSLRWPVQVQGRAFRAAAPHAAPPRLALGFKQVRPAVGAGQVQGCAVCQARVRPRPQHEIIHSGQPDQRIDCRQAGGSGGERGCRAAGMAVWRGMHAAQQCSALQARSSRRRLQAQPQTRLQAWQARAAQRPTAAAQRAQRRWAHWCSGTAACNDPPRCQTASAQWLFHNRPPVGRAAAAACRSRVSLHRTEEQAGTGCNLIERASLRHMPHLPALHRAAASTVPCTRVLAWPSFLRAA